MPQSQKNRAWNRGARLAILYKQMKVNLLNLDKICVTLAKKNRIPTWIGHMPLILVFAGTLAGLLTVGFVISACLIFLLCITFIAKNVSSSAPDDDDSSTGPGYRYGKDGYGYYTGSDDITSEKLD
ncbi:hypothetical protein HV314_04560 [Citrobacter sp. RHBSTW-00887]|uniref:hypothetical protein n=1 Tax=Citrobacter sp. RHBSTW-00887 TaxID=2742668 RepID=UPI0015E9E126|nr:hypothetical protein [Citrobacter sp. RHBSTW-00887]QLS53466.1 hypothetical protein HV314_04560 [Citrobacter sp. RHBSTW-00887]